MKTKPVLLTLLLACAALPVRGDENPNRIVPTIPVGGTTAPRALPGADPLAPTPAFTTVENPPGSAAAPSIRIGSGGGRGISEGGANTAPQAFGGTPEIMALMPVPPVRTGAAPTGGEIEMRVLQIELEVALKQFEKIAAAYVDASTAAELLEQNELSDAQFAKQKKRAEEKVNRLGGSKSLLRSEIARATDEFEARRKQLGLSADAPAPDAPVNAGFPPGGSSGKGGSGFGSSRR